MPILKKILVIGLGFILVTLLFNSFGNIIFPNKASFNVISAAEYKKATDRVYDYINNLHKTRYKSLTGKKIFARYNSYMDLNIKTGSLLISKCEPEVCAKASFDTEALSTGENEPVWVTMGEVQDSNAGIINWRKIDSDFSYCETIINQNKVKIISWAKISGDGLDRIIKMEKNLSIDMDSGMIHYEFPIGNIGRSDPCSTIAVLICNVFPRYPKSTSVFGREDSICHG
jgi:hypothetical protein